MKVLLLTDGIFPYVVGGMQKHSYYLAKHLPTVGIDLTVAHCIYDKNQPLPKEDELNSLLFPDGNYSVKSKAFYFPKQTIPFFGHYILSSFQYSKRVYAAYKNSLKEYDFIIAKGFSGWSILNKKKSVPIGVNFHGYEMFQPSMGLLMRLRSILLKFFVSQNLKKADFVFSYGGGITKLLKKIGVDESKIIEIPGGIDSIKIKPFANTGIRDKMKFLFVGRFEKRKGIEILNKAIKRVLSEQKDFEFHFVGPIPTEMQIKDCTYHGLLKDENKILEFYRMCDVLVVPSLSEGMPNVIMEGMANGCAILATNVGAVSLLVDYNNGWLIDPFYRDVYEGLKNALWASDDEINEKKQNSILKIRDYTWENIALLTKKKLENLF